MCSFRVSGGASHAGHPQSDWRSFGHGTLWALERIWRASKRGGHLLQGKLSLVWGKTLVIIIFFVEIFWTKLSSLEGEILEQEVPWSLGNIAGSQDIDKFEMVVQAFEYEKDHLQPREKAGQPWIFANCSSHWWYCDALVDWGATIGLVQFKRFNTKEYKRPFEAFEMLLVSGGQFRSLEQFGAVGSRIQLTDGMRRTLATFLRGLPGFVDIFANFVMNKLILQFV